MVEGMLEMKQRSFSRHAMDDTRYMVRCVQVGDAGHARQSRIAMARQMMTAMVLTVAMMMPKRSGE